MPSRPARQLRLTVFPHGHCHPAKKEASSRLDRAGLGAMWLQTVKLGWAGFGARCCLCQVQSVVL